MDSQTKPGIQPTVNYQKYTVVGLVLMLTAATIAMHQFKVPMLMGTLATQFGMGDSVSWLMSAFTFTGILLAIPAGSLAQKFTPKVMMIVAPIIVVIGAIIGALSSSSGMMIVSRAIEGIGFIFVSVAGPMSVQKYVDPKHLGAAAGIWATWVCVGNIVGMNLSMPLFNLFGDWRPTWYIYAALTLAMAFVVKAMLKVPDGLASLEANRSLAKGNLMEAIADRDLLTSSLAFSTFNLALMAVLTYVPQAAQLPAVGMSPTEAAFVSTIPMIAALVGSPVVGKLSDTMGRKKLYMLAILATGAGAFLCFLPNRIIIYLGAILIGILGLATPAMIQASMPQIVKRPENLGNSNGFLYLCQNLGMFLGTLVFMPVVKAFGGSFVMGGVFCLAITVIGALLASRANFK